MTNSINATIKSSHRNICDSRIRYPKNLIRITDNVILRDPDALNSTIVNIAKYKFISLSLSPDSNRSQKYNLDHKIVLNPSFTDEYNHTKDNNSDINSSKDINPRVYHIPYSDLNDNLHPGSEIIQRNLFINNASQFHLINTTIQHHYLDIMDLNYTLPKLVPLAPTSKDIQTEHHSHVCNCKVGRNNSNLSAISPLNPIDETI